MGCMQPTAVNSVEVVNNRSRNASPRSTHVLVQQCEGYASVRVFAQPLPNQEVVGEIPSGEQALRFEETDDFIRLRWKQVDGWVRKMNTRPCYSNGPPLPPPSAPAPVASQQVQQRALTAGPGGPIQLQLPTQQATPQAMPEALQAVVALEMLQMLARTVDARGGDAYDAPMKSWNSRDGFHLHCDIRTMSVDNGKRRARCLTDGNQTLFTEEIISSNDSPDFRLKVVAAKGGSVIVGTVPKVPNGYTRYAIGLKEFECTIGAVFTPGSGAFVMHESQARASCDAAKLNDGDIIGFRLRQGKVHFLHNDVSFSSFGVGGEFRPGITLTKEGQILEIMPDEDRVGKLKEGCTVTLPLESAQVHNMRTNFVPLMREHCGKTGDVVDMYARSARVAVNGEALTWDIELFDAQYKRFCRSGCELRDHTVANGGCICDVCMSRMPDGTITRRCDKHDYDICPYCCGKPYAPRAGVKVIPGPTYSWDNHQGPHYNEGVVLSGPDAQGQIRVQWQECIGIHRGPPYQDVIEAKQNGLQGQQRPRQQEDGQQGLELAAGLLGLLVRAELAGR